VVGQGRDQVEPGVGHGGELLGEQGGVTQGAVFAPAPAAGVMGWIASSSSVIGPAGSSGTSAQVRIVIGKQLPGSASATTRRSVVRP